MATPFTIMPSQTFSPFAAYKNQWEQLKAASAARSTSSKMLSSAPITAARNANDLWPTGPTSTISSSRSSASTAAGVSSNPSSIAKTAQTTVKNLSEILNPQMKQEFEAGLESVLPGYKGILAQYGSTVTSMMKGELPADVAAQIDMMTAERNIQGGIVGGPGSIGAFSLARNLGVETLKYMEAGTSEAGRLLDLIPNLSYKPVDQASMFKDIYSTDMQAATSRGSISAQQATQYASHALDKYRFDSELAWTKELSDANKAFEAWKIGEEKDTLVTKQDVNAAVEGSLFNQYASKFFV